MPTATGASGGRAQGGERGLAAGEAPHTLRARCCLVVCPQGMERGHNVTYRIIIERDPHRNAAAPRRERGNICRFLRLFGELARWAMGSRESCAEAGIKVQLD